MITNIIFTQNNFSANSNEATVEFIKDLKSRSTVQIFIVHGTLYQYSQSHFFNGNSTPLLLYSFSHLSIYSKLSL